MLYRYTFEDGYVIICLIMSNREVSYEEKEHGKLISKVPYARV